MVDRQSGEGDMAGAVGREGKGGWRVVLGARMASAVCERRVGGVVCHEIFQYCSALL